MITKTFKTTERTLTKRGVIWLGQTCNLRCQFCYFIDRRDSKEHPEHPFMSLEKAKAICRTLTDVYGNNAVDLQGGEPTLFENIFHLVAYCNSIGLKPTLITNALLLENIRICQRFKNAGVADFLISIHGFGDVHNKLVGHPDAHERQVRALGNLQEIGIPFRFNCVLTKPVIPQLSALSKFAIKTGAKVVNFITFNPFADQSTGRRDSSNVPRYSDFRRPLAEALDILVDAGIEANVRYFPLCMLEERHRKSAYNFQQLPYDHHEWDYASWAWTGLQPQRMKVGEISQTFDLKDYCRLVRYKKGVYRIASIPIIYDLLSKMYRVYGNFQKKSVESKEALYRKAARLHAEVHCQYVHTEPCKRCSVLDICDGFHGDYAAIFGTNEAEPIILSVAVTDPLYYVRNQRKVI